MKEIDINKILRSDSLDDFKKNISILRSVELLDDFDNREIEAVSKFIEMVEDPIYHLSVWTGLNANKKRKN